MSKAAIQAVKAREQRGQEQEIITLSTGVRARFIPVSASLVQDAVSRIKNPPVPVWYNPDKEREEPNPLDPEYQQAIQDADQERGVAAIDVLVLMGVELVDGIPEDDGWLKRLKFLERKGRIDLSEYDLAEPLELEFVYKKFVAVGNEDYPAIMAFSGVGEEAGRARRSFPGDEEGDTA